MRPVRRCALALLFAAAPLAAQNPDTAATKAALIAVDLALAERSRSNAGAFLDAVEPAGAVEFPGVEVLRGTAQLRAPYLARYGGGSSYAWRPLHALASTDGAFGCTLGFATFTSSADSTHSARAGSYITCWRRGADGRWLIAGHQRTENASPAPGVGAEAAFSHAPHSATERGTSSALTEAQDADAAFAKLGREAAGPGPAFMEFAADDAIFPGSIPAPHGKAEIGKAFADYPRERVLWWDPSRDLGAAAGGLAFTIGNASNRLRADGMELTWSHYFTVWRKEPDGSWRWVLDLGSARPRP
jgi:ketosteroid isomerase-like protein